MVKRIKVTTPQFKTKLVRKLKNMYPTCVVEFDDAAPGVAFRLKDRRGRYCSEIVRIHRYTDNVLTKTALDARVRLTTRWSEREKDKVPASITQRRVAQRGRYTA